MRTHLTMVGDGFCMLRSAQTDFGRISYGPTDGRTDTPSKRCEDASKNVCQQCLPTINSFAEKYLLTMAAVYLIIVLLVSVPHYPRERKDELKVDRWPGVTTTGLCL